MSLAWLADSLPLSQLGNPINNWENENLPYLMIHRVVGEVMEMGVRNVSVERTHFNLGNIYD